MLKASCAIGVVLALGAASLFAKEKSIVEPETPLTEAGQKLEARYAEQLDSLKAEILKALPEVDAQQSASFMKAYQRHVELAEAIKNASLAELKAGDKDPVKDKEKKEAAKKASAAAEEAFTQAATNALGTTQAVLKKVAAFLASNTLDAQLVKFIVLLEATPRGLASFAQQGDAQAALVEKLLSDTDLMKQMVYAGGAKDGKYGQAMTIYTNIQGTSPKAKEGILQRLALGISLANAVPIGQHNAESVTDGPATVDPVKRYLHYEKAFLDGQLDPSFKDLTAWDCRWVGYGDEPDHILAWGREMLRNYRPDQIATSDTRWRYVQSVKTEVKYGSADQKNDRPDLQFYQNIIMNGGVCGRRAFFGRYILRCFGIPTIARPQPGHATLVHWTPDGWVICLGASWGKGSVNGKCDIDFLSHTQARKSDKFIEVLRAQWIGLAAGENSAFGFYETASGFWNGVALFRQRAILEEAKTVALAAVGTDIGEANESKEKELVKVVAISEEDKKISMGRDGAMTIPAVACSQPTTNTEKIVFMKSYLGGMQLHYNRLGKEPETFEYNIDAPEAGTYELTAKIVTTSADQHLTVVANDAKEPIDIAVPFTVGKWDKTPPVKLSLTKGSNILRLSRGGENIKGLTIKEFTLMPVK
jgi:hypothetical protein